MGVYLGSFFGKLGAKTSSPPLLHLEWYIWDIQADSFRYFLRMNRAVKATFTLWTGGFDPQLQIGITYSTTWAGQYTGLDVPNDFRLNCQTEAQNGELYDPPTINFDIPP